MPTPHEHELALQRTLVTRDAVIAFMMGGHPRLGARSPLRRIPVVLLRHAASLVWHQKFDATFAVPNGPHRMGVDRKEIGWSIEGHQLGFVSVLVERPITPRHAVARVRLEYTCVDDCACFKAGGAELRLWAVDDDDEAHYVVRGSVAFAVDDVSVGGVPITVPQDGVRLSAEDRSDGAPLEGDTEWRANVSSRAPLRLAPKPPLFCESPTCFCRRRPATPPPHQVWG